MEPKGPFAKLNRPPDLTEWELLVWGAYFQLGRDFNGRPLYSERRAWLDERGITSPDARDEVMSLWASLDAENAEIAEEQEEARRKRTSAPPPPSPHRKLG